MPKVAQESLPIRQHAAEAVRRNSQVMRTEAQNNGCERARCSGIAFEEHAAEAGNYRRGTFAQVNNRRVNPRRAYNQNDPHRSEA